MTLVQKEVQRVMLRKNGVEKQVRPESTILTYDFTQSDAGWNANGCSRDGRGFYRTNSWSDGGIYCATSEVFDTTPPKKITIVFNKVYQSSGTSLGRYGASEDWGYNLPWEYAQQNTLCLRCNSVNTNVTLSGNVPTGVVTWEMDVNSSTTPRTVTHKITGLSNYVDSTSGILDHLWSETGNGPRIRIVNRNGGTGSMCIQSATFEY